MNVLRTDQSINSLIEIYNTKHKVYSSLRSYYIGPFNFSRSGGFVFSSLASKVKNLISLLLMQFFMKPFARNRIFFDINSINLIFLV